MNAHPVVRIGLLLRRVKVIETRKKVQKIVHILQAMGAPFPERFDFHHYGPFSSELWREIEAFEAEGLVTEAEIQGNLPTFRLEPTGKLLALLEEDSGVADEPWVEWAEELNSKRPRRLEGISTLLYFHQRLWPVETWSSKFKELKPQLMDEFEQCHAEAMELLEMAGKSAA
jgi:uncharacterized protein YwgA